jgi:hypothetical protein
VRAAPARCRASVVITDLVLATSFPFWDQSRTTLNATAPQGEGVPIRYPGLAEGHRRWQVAAVIYRYTEARRALSLVPYYYGCC